MTSRNNLSFHVMRRCKCSYLFIGVSPLCGRVPMRLRNGLEINPGANQTSLSGRSLSCSLDELGLKYLNHRGKRTEPYYNDS